MTEKNAKPVRLNAQHLAMLAAGQSVPVIYQNTLIGIVRPMATQVKFPRGSTDGEIMDAFRSLDLEPVHVEG